MVDEFGRRFVLKPILYCSEAEQPMLSMMRLQEEGGQLTFQGTNCTLVLPGGCTLYGKSINKLLHLTDFAREGKYTAVVTTRSQADQGHINDEAENGDDSSEAMDIVEQRSESSPVPDTRSSSPIPIDNSSVTSSNVSTRIRKPKRLSPNYLWHLRLAHASTTVMSKIHTIKSSFDSSGCLSCIRAKQHRLPFRLSDFKATKKLQHVHSDLSGPHIFSIEGKKWYLTLMCDLTRYKWVYTLSSKSSEVVFKAIEEWVAMVERESACKVESIRTDGGREYWGDLTPFLKKLGIRHIDTAPYTPESNGRAERLNRVINEAARAMLIHANLPQQFWPEAVKTAVYTWNLLPHSAIGDKSPHECYYAKGAPDLDHLRPFGCLAMVHIPEARRGKESKFTLRSHDAIFVEHVSSSSWKVYNFARKCFVVSHDITFFETKFPSGKEFSHLHSANSRGESLGQWTILLHRLWSQLKLLSHLHRWQRTSRPLYTTVLSLNHLPQRRHSPCAFTAFSGTPNLPVIMMQ